MSGARKDGDPTSGDLQNTRTIDALLKHVSQRTGLAFSGNARQSAELGLKRAMRTAGETDAAEYYQKTQKIRGCGANWSTN